jgi:hypothetical protein
VSQCRNGRVCAAAVFSKKALLLLLRKEIAAAIAAAPATTAVAAQGNCCAQTSPLHCCILQLLPPVGCACLEAVEVLRASTSGQRARSLQQPISQRRLAMINVCDDAKVSVYSGMIVHMRHVKRRPDRGELAV